MPDEFYIYLGVYAFLAILGFCIQERALLKDLFDEKVLKKPKKTKSTRKGENGEDEEITEDEEYKNDEEEPLVKRDKKKGKK